MVSICEQRSTLEHTEAIWCSGTSRAAAVLWNRTHFHWNMAAEWKRYSRAGLTCWNARNGTAELKISSNKTSEKTARLPSFKCKRIALFPMDDNKAVCQTLTTKDGYFYVKRFEMHDSEEFLFLFCFPFFIKKSVWAYSRYIRLQ